MLHYTKLFFTFLRINLQKAMAYPKMFWFFFFLVVLESLTVYIALDIVFRHVTGIAGWSYHEMLVLTGIFMLSNGFSWIFFKAGVSRLDLAINQGDLDGYLVKPIDTQFLVTVMRQDIEDAGRSVVGVFVLIAGLKGIHPSPGLVQWMLFFFTFLAGEIVLYSVMFSLKCISFKSIQGWASNAISWRFHDLARYPTDIYRGGFRMLFTFVFPLVFVTTVPTQALTGQLTVPFFVGSLVTAVLSFAISRTIWKRALRTYASASS